MTSAAPPNKTTFESQDFLLVFVHHILLLCRTETLVGVCRLLRCCWQVGSLGPYLSKAGDNIPIHLLALSVALQAHRAVGELPHFPRREKGVESWERRSRGSSTRSCSSSKLGLDLSEHLRWNIYPELAERGIFFRHILKDFCKEHLLRGVCVHTLKRLFNSKNSTSTSTCQADYTKS